jgi:hypothetical protein
MTAAESGDAVSEAHLLKVLDAVSKTLPPVRHACDSQTQQGAFEGQLSSAASELAAAKRRLIAEQVQKRLDAACTNLDQVTALCSVALAHFQYEDAGYHVEQSRRELEDLQEHKERVALQPLAARV